MRLSSLLSPQLLIFFTNQIKKTKCLFIVLIYLEFSLKTCHMHLIISLLLVGLFSIIIYPKHAFKIIFNFKFIASEMNWQCTSSMIPQCQQQWCLCQGNPKGEFGHSSQLYTRQASSAAFLEFRQVLINVVSA